ncbi:Prolamin-like domain containing protein [Trema orientale]|uniref:Prolamin-like domain containing protein n=1 Tax=Trema orientale TaxID=63057 RepID=A0A2P5DD52_TREOI|nr:Prolamin-like domain containing protein [Trema orientale]
MQKLSIYLSSFFCFFTLICFTEGCPYKGESCQNEFLLFQPCIGEILSVIYSQRPMISSSCCATILDIGHGHCPDFLPYFLVGQESCTRIATYPPPSRPSSANNNFRYN